MLKNPGTLSRPHKEKYSPGFSFSDTDTHDLTKERQRKKNNYIVLLDLTMPEREMGEEMMRLRDEAALW